MRANISPIRKRPIKSPERIVTVRFKPFEILFPLARDIAAVPNKTLTTRYRKDISGRLSPREPTAVRSANAAAIKGSAADGFRVGESEDSFIVRLE